MTLLQTLLLASSISLSSSWIPSYTKTSPLVSTGQRTRVMATKPKPGEEDDIVDVEFEKVSHDDFGEDFDFSQFENMGSVSDDIQDIGTQTVQNFDLSQLEDPTGGNRERPTIPKELLEAMKAEGMDTTDMEVEAMEMDSGEQEEQEEVVKESRRNDRQSTYLEPPKTLMDLSLDSGDPRWKQVRIPWCRGMEYIDGKLAFLAEIEGETYGIGMPYDHAVAIVQVTPDAEGKKTFENIEDANVRYIDPDKYEEEDDSQELMELMARQVQEKLGDELLLRKTPKVLTISGDLGKYTDNWEQGLMDEPVGAKDMMEGMDDFVNNIFREEKKEGDPVDEFDIANEKEIAEMFSFFRKELGDEEFEKTMKEDMSDEDKELAKLFEFELDESDFAETPEAEAAKSKEEALAFHPDSDGVALKLIAFEFADQSKSYQLVKLLQPVPLVGKKVDEPAEEGLRFELLTPQEEEVIIPKLQNACQEDLEKAGLSLDDIHGPAKSS